MLLLRGLAIVSVGAVSPEVAEKLLTIVSTLFYDFTVVLFPMVGTATNVTTFESDGEVTEEFRWFMVREKNPIDGAMFNIWVHFSAWAFIFLNGFFGERGGVIGGANEGGW